jgi:hypothetical protein
VLLATWCAAAAPAVAQLGPSDLVGPAGVGPIKFGMTLAEVRGAGVILTSTGEGSGPGCYFARAAAAAGLDFMVRDGKVVRADVEAPATLVTVDGFKRGDTGATVRAFYAATKPGVSDVPAAAPGSPTTLVAPALGSADDTLRLAYDVDPGGTVVAIHAGFVPRHFTGCPQ